MMHEIRSLCPEGMLSDLETKDYVIVSKSGY